MREIRSQKALEMALCMLEGFSHSKVSLEQYETPADIAAEVLWKAQFESFTGKVIVDLGCGPGILGIGCLLLGAKQVYFVEKDPEAVQILRKNLARVESEHSGQAIVVEGDVEEFSAESEVDFVIMNPPFGTKVRHADKKFLLKAFSLSDSVYSFHKTSTSEYILRLASKNGFDLLERFNFFYLLKATMAHHRKAKERIEVSCFHFAQSQDENDVSRR